MTQRTSARLAARASPSLALLILLLLLPQGTAAYDVPYRQIVPGCHWWQLRGAPGASITYDVSDYGSALAWWRPGVENWDTALGSLMEFDWYTYPSGETHLRWEGQPPLDLHCASAATACWAIDPDWCDGGSQLTQSAIYFDRDKYLNLSLDQERIAASAHEWGHNLNLGEYDPLRGMCASPPRVMGYLDGQGCITSPSCAEQAAVIDVYWLLPWWRDRDGDCFDNDDEDFMSTDDWDDCADTRTANDEDPDAWPPDFNDDQRVNLTDLLPLREHWNCQVGDACYAPRFDLNTDGRINLGDIGILRVYFHTICA